MFDTDPAIIGIEINGLKIRSITELFGVIKSERKKIEAACIAVPSGAPSRQPSFS